MVGNLASLAQFPNINRKDAERFLAILDDRTHRFTFQTFDDNKDRKEGRLARIFHGTLDQHFSTLVNLNHHYGAGVFVTVNATNSPGRTIDCITEVRAYFADLDGVPLDNIKRLTGNGHTKLTITALLGPIPECLRARPYRGLADQIRAGLSDYPPSYGVDIVEQCGQLREMRDKRGRVSNPVWRNVLEVLVHCVDGEPLAHEYSSGDPRYTCEETRRELDRLREYGPTTCAKFHSDNPTICEACELWDKTAGKSTITSPIVLGRRREPVPAASPLETAQEQGIEIIRGDALLSTAAPPRNWLVEKFIPDAEVTMLGGDGGAGKTTLALQLATGCVGCGNWIGLKVKPCNVLYVSAEDPRDEIHYRLEKVSRGMRTGRADVRGLALVDLAGKDATIATFEKNGLIKPTALFGEIEKAGREHEAGCIILDSVADFFGGNENERREVRAFIGLLRGLAMRLSAAIVILAHPSVDGIKSGRGYSGSTHWNNAVRSRMYFTSPEEDKNGPPNNPDGRLLELAKSNRARSGEKIHLVWYEGLFHAVSPEVAGRPPNTAETEEVFLQLLSKLSKQGVHVSPKPSVCYAPKVMAKLPGSKGIGKAALDRAMHQLLEKGKIRVIEHGPPSRRTRHLEVCTNHDAIAGRGATGSQEPGLQPGAPSVATRGYGGSEHTPV
jgi:RecA-family ATPase